MKKIEVVIHGDSFNSVHQALRDAKVGPFSVSEIKVFNPAAPLGNYRGGSYPIGRDLIKLEWVVMDPEVKPTLQAIGEGLDALGAGNAEVVVHPIEESMRLSNSVWTRAHSAR